MNYMLAHLLRSSILIISLITASCNSQNNCTSQNKKQAEGELYLIATAFSEDSLLKVRKAFLENSIQCKVVDGVYHGIYIDLKNKSKALKLLQKLKIKNIQINN